MISIRQIYSSALFRKSFVYIFCDGVNRAIPFLLLPFITHYLTPADYGIITNFNVYIQILAVFCYSCTLGAVPVNFFKLSPENFRKYASSVILLNTGALIICAVVAIFSNTIIYKSLNISYSFQLLALFSIWFSGMTQLNMTLWRCEERPFAFGIFQISQSALNAFTTILFVIVLLLGWKGRIYSMMLATIVFGVISVVILIRKGYCTPKISGEFVKQALFFALPLIPHALSFWFKSGVDKVLLTGMVGLSSNGLYSVALTWGSVVTMFLTAFNNAYAPFLYKKLASFDKDKNGTIHEQKRLVKLIWSMIGLTLIFVIFMYFVSCMFIRWVYAPVYFESVAYLPWVMLVQFFQGVYLMFVCFVHYTLKTKVLGLITFSCSLLQVGVTYLMIRYWGAIGAAASSALTALIICFFVVRYAMKVYKLPWFNNSSYEYETA